MPNPPAITRGDREQVAELHAEGYSRAKIARTIVRAPSTVGKIARELGLTFDRTRTEQATAAKQADNRARRTSIIGRLYDQADKQLDRLDLPQHELAQASAGDLVQWHAEYLPAGDVKALVQAVGSATAAAIKLEQVDADQGAEDTKSLLGELAIRLGAIHEQDTGSDGDA